MHLFRLCQFPLIFTNININLCEKVSFFVIVVFGNCVSLTGRPISNANSIFIGTSQCSIFHICLPLMLNIENHVLPLHIIVDRNQVSIFFIETISYSQVQNIS